MDTEHWIGTGLAVIGGLGLAGAVVGPPDVKLGDLVGGAVFGAAGVYLLSRPVTSHRSGHRRTRGATVGVTRHNRRARYRRH